MYVLGSRLAVVSRGQGREYASSRWSLRGKRVGVKRGEKGEGEKRKGAYEIGIRDLL